MLKAAAQYIGVDAASFSEVLVTQTRELRGEVISTPLEVREVSWRLSLSLFLYYLAPSVCLRHACSVFAMLAPTHIVACSPLSLQAVDSRDSVAMGLYSRLFKWIISKLNVSLKGPETFHSVGVLDIFGFENFEVSLIPILSPLSFICSAHASRHCLPRCSSLVMTLFSHHDSLLSPPLLSPTPSPPGQLV